jgi:hypothetical protein
MTAPMMPNSDPNTRTLTSTMKPESLVTSPMIVGWRM